MNNMFPEIPAELKRRQIEAEMAAIRLGEAVGRQPSLVSRGLASLGRWMIVLGGRLRDRQIDPVRDSSVVEFIKRTA
jgi:hypothetical protein